MAPGSCLATRAQQEIHMTLKTSGWKLLAVFVVATAGTRTSLAQGTAFTYQGRLTVDGAPANGIYDFRYRLSLDPYGNAYYGSSVLANAQVISDGLFTATLDFGAGSFTGSNYWLEVDVRTNGAPGYTVLSPLQPVTPSPYAVFSGTSSHAVSADSAATATAATTAKAVAADGVDSIAIKNNAVTAAKIASGQVVKSLTIAGNALYDNVTIEAGDNVKITPAGQTLTIAAAGGQAVTRLNGLDGAVTLSGDADIAVTAGSGTISLSTSATSQNTPGTIVKRNASGSISGSAILFGGNMVLHAFGVENFFGGVSAGAYTSSTATGNVGFGYRAISANSDGNYNTAIGWGALSSQTSGDNNIAIGVGAGRFIKTGRDNIYIGNTGLDGDSDVIRIGDPQKHQSASIAGIYSHSLAVGVPVYVVESGQLGTMPSSKKYKQDVENMDDASDVLLRLRPVRFRYNADIDPTGSAQFGLIAEDVNEVAPDLVVRDEEHGVYTVRYQAVDSMLLNEFLKAHRKMLDQEQEIRTLRQTNDLLDRRVSSLEETVRSLTNLVGERP